MRIVAGISTLTTHSFPIFPKFYNVLPTQVRPPSLVEESARDYSEKEIQYTMNRGNN